MIQEDNKRNVIKYLFDKTYNARISVFNVFKIIINGNDPIDIHCIILPIKILIV